MVRDPQRIVSLAPSHTELLFALGLGDKVVGVTSYCDYPEDAKRKTAVDGFASPDIEKVIALKPSLILAFGSLQTQVVRELEQRGQNVFWTYPHTLVDVLESFEKIGELTGRETAARQLKKRVQEIVDDVQERLETIREQARPTVFRVHSGHPIGTVGGDAFQSQLYHLAGGRNIFADTRKDYFEVDIKTLLELDPDIIVVAGRDGIAIRRIRRQAGWENLTAVRTNRIVEIPAELICRAGPRLGLTVERLAKAFHPERFQ